MNKNRRQRLALLLYVSIVAYAYSVTAFTQWDILWVRKLSEFEPATTMALIWVFTIIIILMDEPT